MRNFCTCPICLLSRVHKHDVSCQFHSREGRKEKVCNMHFSIPQEGMKNAVRAPQVHRADCHAEATPLNPSAIPILKPCDDTAPVNCGWYQKLSGSLDYFSIRTRPDISTAVASLSHFNHNSAPQYWATQTHILHYLRGTADYGLLHRTASQQPHTGNRHIDHCPYLLAFSDSNWVQSSVHAFISGYMLHSAPRWTSTTLAAPISHIPESTPAQGSTMSWSQLDKS